MNTQHAKSPCCRGVVRKYGIRRRQCTLCKKTWRVRKKKRGRKRLRATSSLVVQYLRHEIPSLHARARARTCASDAIERRLHGSRDFFLSHTSWPHVPTHGILIALADAMMREIKGEMHTAYFILTRPVESNNAIIMEPYIQTGKETHEGWYEAFRRVPLSVRRHILALVCDSHQGLVSVAFRNHWLLQRCNFHIIASIQGRRSRFAASRHRPLGERLYRLISQILTLKDQHAVNKLITEIESIGWETDSTQLRKIISGFVAHADQYRTYLSHPELRLPRTNNTCETLIGGFQDLTHRMRGYSSVRSFRQWLNAYLKNRKTVTCNPSDQPN